ncbi:amino acid adenylation domain-containing protein [Pseudonocardia xishanensis]|uniref:Phenyloxazoline synthase MbtB n=1 Tax=Pseudonocardia xishanensis TaxID=630995 RepID=A0ABP8RTU8_9PSEU
MTAPADRQITVDELRQLVADLVEEDVDDVDPGSSLFEQGLQSIALMRLVSRFRADGYRIGFADLAEQPTLAEWARLLVERREPTIEEAVPAATSDRAVDREFDLALLQHAYWIGRDPTQRLGGVAPHLYLEFDGSGVDPDRLRAAFDAVVRRHAMLRVVVGDNGRQRVAPAPARGWNGLHVHDLRALAADEARTRLEDTRQRMSHELLDIGAGEVFRAELSLLPPEVAPDRTAPTRLHLDVDMIAADAVSYRVLLADLARAYENGGTLPPLSYEYRDYRAARPAQRADARAEAQRYWAERLELLPGAPELPLRAGHAGPARAERLSFFLDPERRAALTRAVRSRGVTASAAVAAAFAEVVGYWSAQDRFLLNVPLFDREPVHPAVDEVVGDFTGSVMLEIDLREQATFLDRARAVQAQLHADAAHSAYTGLEVLRDLGRLAGDQVLAPVVFTSGLDLGELFDARARRCFGDPVWIISQGPQVVLDSQTSEIDGGILVNWDVRANEFADGVPAAMFGAFTRLVESLADDAAWERPVGDLLPQDQRAVRARADDTARAVLPELLHGDFFDAVRSSTAHRPAVLWDGGSLTHGELAGRALRVAAGLRARGVVPGETVAVTLPRGPDQIVAVLGVLAAGGTYVPVGVEQPPARTGRIAAVSGHRITLAAEPGPGRVALDELAAHEPLAQPEPVDPEQPAYVLFTSGSTGEPKGVEVPHRAAMATIRDLVRRLRLGAQDRTLMVSALDFDLSVFDIFAVLAVGGAVVVLDQERRQEARHWAELVREHRVTVLNCVPALLDALLRSDAELGDTLRQVLLGGDKVGTDLPGRLRERVPGCAFAGLGGTTETAIHSTWQPVEEVPADWSCVPYGTPLDGVRLRVVDHLGRPAPDWVAGELWIGGAGVSHGYRGDPERTADRFLVEDGVRWYRTGDMARYRPDGVVEFLGRRDNQVKINGYRIELGEVEAAALEIDGVDAAVAVVVEGATRALALAVRPDPVGSSARELDEAWLRADLDARLPVHMVPRIVVVLDDLPLTANGKIDRQAVLRQVAASGGARPDARAPRTPLERVIADVWAEVIGLERIGSDDSLFAVGGDSVLATAIVAVLRERLDTDEVSVRMLFGSPTVAGLAAAMLAGSGDPDRLAAVAGIAADVSAMSDTDIAAELAAGGAQ